MNGAGPPVPEVSIVIPTWNGMATLPDVVRAIDGQDAPLWRELVVIDSGSTDGTVEFLRGRADRIIEIPHEEFGHGSTRNRGVAACRAPLVVLVVQDAIPATPAWLRELVAPFARDRRLAGAFARQLPRDDADAVVRHGLAGWIASRETPRVVEIGGKEELARRPPRERFELSAFDNVCACIRREVWASHPFEDVAIAEDVRWARDVLCAGFRIAYVPSSAVVHSHRRSARAELERTRAIHRELRELFGFVTIPSLPGLGWAIASSLALNARLWAGDARPNVAVQERLRDLGRAVGLALAYPLGQYLGGRDARTSGGSAPPEDRP